MNNEHVKIITPGEPVDTCYGLEIIELEPDHINALMEGKQIYTTINCSEYAIIVKMHSNEESEKT